MAPIKQLSSVMCVIGVGVLGIASSFALAACSSPKAPGMTVVSSSSSTSGPESILVAFPLGACSGSDSVVFIDDTGAFVGAVAPGTAAYLAFPPSAKKVLVLSARDVSAPAGSWFSRHEIAPPGSRVEHGVVVTVPRADAKTCPRDGAPVPAVVTFEQATAATKELTWLDVNTDAAAQWLEQHKARIAELLQRVPPPPRGDGSAAAASSAAPAPAPAPVATGTTRTP